MPSRRKIARAIFVAWIAGLATSFLFVSVTGQWGSLETQAFLLLASAGPGALAYIVANALAAAHHGPGSTTGVTAAITCGLLGFLVAAAIEVLGMP